MNKLNINVAYGGRKEILNCSRQELIALVKKRFCLDGEVELYKRFKGTKERIELQNIKDLMAIEVETKKRTRSSMNGHANRFLEDYEIGECSTLATSFELMMRKLLENKTLTGKERKDVIAMIQNRAISKLSLKRKRKEIIPRKEVPMLNKRVQVFIRDVKDSCSQTDPIRQENLNGPITVDDLIIRMKRMAAWNKKECAEALMEKTYNERKRYIHLKRIPVKMTREIFPLLFSLQEVKNELERIFNFGKCKEFLENVQKYSRSILQNADKKNAIYHLATRSIQKAENEKQSRYAMQVGALLLLPQALSEEASFVRLKNQTHTCGEFPYIYAPTMELEDLFHLEGTSHFKIIVEGITLCNTRTFTTAVLCLVASFYIFNINYTPESCRTYVAMEKLFLEGNETEEVDGFTSQMIKYFKLKAK